MPGLGYVILYSLKMVMLWWIRQGYWLFRGLSRLRFTAHQLGRRMIDIATAPLLQHAGRQHTGAYHLSLDHHDLFCSLEWRRKLPIGSY